MTRKDLLKVAGEALAEKADLCVDFGNETDMEIVANKNIIDKLDYLLDVVEYIKVWKKEKENKTHFCNNCGKTFIVNKTEYKAYGIPFARCPFCNIEEEIEEVPSLKINENNLLYPNHFASFKDGVKIENSKVQEWCRECLRNLKEHPDSYFSTIGSGDTFVIGIKYEDEIDLYVGKGYEEIYIPNSESDENDILPF